MTLRSALPVLVFLVLALQPSVAAAPNAQSTSPGLFVAPSTPGTLDRSGEETIERARLVGVDFTQLAAADGSPQSPEPGSTLLLNLFEDVAYTAVLERVEFNPQGGFTWLGKLEGLALSQVTLVVNEGVLVGNVTSPDGFFQVRYAGEGVHAVYQIDQTAFPPEMEPVPVPLEQYQVPAAEPPGADDGSVIDILVVYTGDARAAAGGPTAIENAITMAVAETNTSYENSQIIQRLNLAHMAEVSYAETGIMSGDLACLRATSDDCLDTVHSLRDTYAADEVVLIVENGGGLCGVAYMMASVSVGFAPHAFAVVDRGCATGYYSFGHELGHTMGARHDWYVDQETTPYPYSHGWVNVPDRWRTIMAYNKACDDQGFDCIRLQYWSNPGLTYGSDPMGSATADNHLTLNNTRTTVANFRVRTDMTDPTVTVHSPDGGESWAVGASQDITWSADDNVGVTAVDLYYSTNGGSTWNSIASGETDDGTYPWTIPNDPSTTCRVQVVAHDAATNSGEDMSDADFTILPNGPPYEPSTPSPTDGAEDQDIHVDLSWTGGDPDGDIVTYTVSLEEGPCPPAVPVCEDLTSPACDPGTLDPSTQYCWQVIATDEHSATTPGPTWQFTTTAPICSEGIANGGFETTSAWEVPATAYPAAYSTAQAHGGARSMRVGILSTAANRFSYSSARQTVTIPAGAASATLGFWLYSLSGEASSRAPEIPEQPLAPTVEEAALADDQQYVIILNQSGDWIDTLLWQKRNDARWIYYEYDLSAYRGRTIKLQFGVYNDGIGGVTGMYVDDVSLQICPTGPGNSPPNTPAAPSPGNGATDQPVNLTLTWTGGDPNGDAVTYDVYLAGSLQCDDVAAESCPPPTLAYDKSYEWYVVATDVHGASTTGPDWTFQTVAGPSYTDWYLAEGYTGNSFDTKILIQNPTALTATVEVTYMLEGGGTLTRSLEVGPTSRHTITANDADQVGPDQAFATRVRADLPIVVERAMYWPNGPETLGGHGAVGIPEPSTTWYFAEGFTGASFETFLLLQNPNAAPAVVQVQYMLEGGQVLTRQHTVPAESRLTILTNDAGEVGLDQSFSTKLVADRPIIAERAMYFPNEGHDASGVMMPATTWYLAEGYTDSGTETYILVQNPNASDATVEVAYMLQDGGTITRTHVIAATSRHTIQAHNAAEVGPGEAFSTKLVSDQPIIVERAMYWPDGSGGLAGHDTQGSTALAEVWNLAEGYTGNGFATFILIQNPNEAQATIQVTYMLDGGGTLVKTYDIPPESRYTIETHDPGEVGPDQTFATRLVSDLPIVVERAMYFDNGGHASCAVPQ